MTRPLNQAWVLKRRPVGAIEPADLDYQTRPVDALMPGQVLVRVIYLSLDPTNRIWMSDMDQYMPPVEIGEVMRGGTLGIVEESLHDDFKPGDLVMGTLGWQKYGIIDPKLGLAKLPVIPGLPLTAFMGVLGFIGATAYFGLLDICAPKPGETIVVSAAAGAVGSLVGQIGKIKGCRVIGIAGSDDKCRWITQDLGFDAAINYKTENVLDALRHHAPGGVDIYFENVGGEILDAVLTVLNVGARISLCGLISSYNATEPVPGPYMFRNLLMKRVMLKGFIVSDYIARFPEAIGALAQWLMAGQLKYRVDVVQGLEQAPIAVNKLFDGTNQGKLVVQVSAEG
jgi:NADPH-dependent curcumin reductase CurA